MSISGWIHVSEGWIQSGIGWVQIGTDAGAAAWILRHAWLHRKGRRWR